MVQATSPHAAKFFEFIDTYLFGWTWGYPENSFPWLQSYVLPCPSYLRLFNSLIYLVFKLLRISIYFLHICILECVDHGWGTWSFPESLLIYFLTSSGNPVLTGLCPYILVQINVAQSTKVWCGWFNFGFAMRCEVSHCLFQVVICSVVLGVTYALVALTIVYLKPAIAQHDQCNSMVSHIGENRKISHTEIYLHWIL